MMPQVAIPSYKRPATITRKTLPLLDRLGFVHDNITVFVADEAEQAEYRTSLDAAGYDRVQVQVTAPGLSQSRNLYHAHYPVGVQLFSFDDDVQDMLVARQGKLHPVTADEWRQVCDLAWRACRRSGARLWGVYAAANAFYMAPTLSYGLCYIVGACYACINWGDDPARRLTGVDPSDDTGEDHERSMQCYLADGALVRVNWLTVKTNYWTEPGGMQETRTEANTLRRCVQLTRMYPGLCTLRTTKKSADLRLRDRRKPKGARVA